MVAPEDLAARTVPVKFVSTICDQSASSASSVGIFLRHAGRVHQNVHLAELFNHRIVQRCIESRSSTSLGTRSERRPSASISVAIASTWSSRRELATTSAPAAGTAQRNLAPQSRRPAGHHRDSPAQIEKLLPHQRILPRRSPVFRM